MKLSIFGPRGCGKTTYLTCLYGKGSKLGSFAMIANDQVTRNYLRERWEAIQEGLDIQATALATIPLNLTFSANQKSYEVELKDYGGALVMQHSKPDEIKKKLRETLFASFAESEAVMIFIDAGSQEDSLDRRQELECLIDVLRSQHKQALISRPIAIVVSKWDKVVHEDTGIQNPIQFLEQKYADLYSIIKNFSHNMHIFAVSAYGIGARDPNAKSKLAPFNLEKPFCWIAEKIDEIGYLALETLEKENPHDLKKLFSGFQKFAQKVYKGPWYEKAITKVTKYRQEIWKIQRRNIAIASVLCFLVAMICFGILEYSQYSNIDRVLDDTNVAQNPDQAIAEAQIYVNESHLIAEFIGWKQKIQEKISKLQSSNEQQSFEKIEVLFVNKTSDWQAREERLKKYKIFLTAYPSSKHGKTVVGYQQLEEAQKRKEIMQKEFTTLKREWPKGSMEMEYWQSWISNAEKFIQDYPDFEEIVQVHKDIEEAKKQLKYLDDQKLKALMQRIFESLQRDYPKDSKDPFRWQAWIQKMEQFAHEHPDFEEIAQVYAKIEEAKKQLQQLEIEIEYRKFLVELDKTSDDQKYLTLCREYLAKKPTLADKLQNLIQKREQSVLEKVQRVVNGKNSYKEKIQCYVEYLETKEYQDEGCHNKAQMALILVEKELYEEIRSRADLAQCTPERLREANQLATEYIEHSYDKRYLILIKAWQQWYQRLEQGISISVTIQRAVLDINTDLFKGVYSPDTYVELIYKGNKYVTDEKEDNKFPMYWGTTSLVWKLQDTALLRIRLWNTDWGNEYREVTSQDGFLLKFFAEYQDQPINIFGNMLYISSNVVWLKLPPPIER